MTHSIHSTTQKTGETDIISRITQVLGYEISSVEYDGKNTHQIKASKIENGLKNDTTIFVLTSKSKSGIHKIKSLEKKTRASGTENLIIVSKNGYTEEANEYSEKNNISLLDMDKILLPESKPTKETHKIFDKVFKSQITMEDAKKEFEESRRKSFFGLFGQEEQVDSAFQRFAPIACYTLKKKEPKRLLSSGKVTTYSAGNFFVNLHTCHLYFLNYGLTGGKCSLKSTNLLRRMIDLPEKSVILFSELLEVETLYYEKMSEEQKRVFDENLEYLKALEVLGLVEEVQDGKILASTVKLPEFGDPRFDLNQHVEMDSLLESDNPADEIIYPADGVLELLKDLYNSEGELSKVIYLPYFACKYVDSEKNIRYKSLEKLVFKDG
ncbi:MAG: restriction endonuclease [Candidatus Altiarchaeota archaeon]|nr:restriction endonuclease [Candidatus Altiarchaeota archaeon]